MTYSNILIDIKVGRLKLFNISCLITIFSSLSFAFEGPEKTIVYKVKVLSFLPLILSAPRT